MFRTVVNNVNLVIPFPSVQGIVVAGFTSISVNGIVTDAAVDDMVITSVDAYRIVAITAGFIYNKERNDNKSQT